MLTVTTAPSRANIPIQESRTNNLSTNANIALTQRANRLLVLSRAESKVVGWTDSIANMISPPSHTKRSHEASSTEYQPGAAMPLKPRSIVTINSNKFKRGEIYFQVVRESANAVYHPEAPWSPPPIHTHFRMSDGRPSLRSEQKTSYILCSVVVRRAQFVR